MVSKFSGPGLYEFLIEAELQHYYNAFRNDLKVQNVAQLKYVSEDDLGQIGMSRPEIRRLTKYFNKHCPQTYLGKMKKKLLFRKDEPITVTSLGAGSQSSSTRNVRSVAPGRHIIQADSIANHKTLGSGEFGTVQQGVWTSDDGERIQVAIKSLSQDRMENNPVEFLKEAAIMHTVDHEHIVRLYGVVLDTTALMLVTELAPLRSLLECLKEPSMRQNLSVPTLFDFAIQICDGMEYLESKRLIHRDLAARNILVFSRSKVKISDFGLSRALGVGKDYYQTNFNVNLKLPIAWCAPECINFLRFTSASDVWAFGVTLWEMFSYGFQPWAALTGQQILEAIDEPNFQRLERPECCPYEMYNQIMCKCWQHDPLTRPTFVQLSQLLPECKPEQVQTLRESETRSRRDLLVYEAADVITVLDKKPVQASSVEDGIMLWKGVLRCGKSGLFNPANTITYLGSSLPSVNQQSQSPFHRSDSRSSSMRKGRLLSADMISVPQGDLKHTGHMGTDGQFFGDITFLTSKCWVPRQVVSPYKPEPSSGDIAQSKCGRSQLPSGSKSLGDSNSEIHSSDTAPLLCAGAQASSDDHSQRRKPRRIQLMAPLGVSNPVDDDHEYHEISDEENEIISGSNSKSENIGLSNPALSSRSQSPLDSPGFDKSFNLGPSLVDEVFGALQRDSHQPDDIHPTRNEAREMARHKKKFATVKPISSSDRRTLDQAIAIANELATRSMLDLDRPGKHSNTNNSLDDISSPRTPSTPTHRRKFSFILGANKSSDRERRNYSQEAASIPDIQSTLTEEAKEAYNSLVEKPSLGNLGFLTPTFENKSPSFHFPENVSLASKKSDFFDNEPLSPPPSTSVIFPSSSTNSPQRKLPRTRTLSSKTETEDELNEEDEEETDGNPLRLLRLNKQTNILPLPPREKAKAILFSNTVSSRHQRKHPLLIPGRIPIPSGVTREPPPPPPKPQRQKLLNDSNFPPETSKEPSPQPQEPTITNSNLEEASSRKSDQHSNSSFENRSSVSYSVSESSISLYENFETENISEGSEASRTNKVFSGISNRNGDRRSTSSLINSFNYNKLSDDQRQESTKTQVPTVRKSFEPDFREKELPFSKSRESEPRESTFSNNNEFQPSMASLSISQANEAHDFAWSPLKVKTIQRILGASNTEEECIWSLEITEGDSARAVKLLRLKALLPESLLTSDINRVISVLEMSHWDVARASAFLLKNPIEVSPRKSLFRSDLLNSNNISLSPGEITSIINNSNISNTTPSDDKTVRDYVRPTQV